MSTALLVLANVIGSIVFLFFLWRRLHEDYQPTKVFLTGFYIIGGILIGFVVSVLFVAPHLKRLYFFDPQGLWFWGSLTGVAITLTLSLLHFKMRFFEGLEAASLGLFFWFFILLFSYSLIYKISFVLIFSIIIAALIFLFFYIDKKYKSFSWYKSGKVGFSGLTLLAIFFLVRAAIAILNPSMLSFIGKIDALISAILSFIFFLSVYNLSGKYE